MKRLLRTICHQVRKLLDTILLGTRFQEWVWQKPQFKESKNYEEFFFENIKQPRREYLAGRIFELGPIRSAMEIGCNQGFNLYNLAKKQPELELFGLDINPRAVREGNMRFQSAGMDRVHLSEGACDDLKAFESNSVDLIFSEAIIIYIGPDKIRKTLKECVRVARKAILLMEWNWSSGNQGSLSIYKTGHWVHDYSRLLSELSEVELVTITKIPDTLNYQDILWKQYGALVTVRLKTL